MVTTNIKRGAKRKEKSRRHPKSPGGVEGRHPAPNPLVIVYLAISGVSFVFVIFLFSHQLGL